MSLYYGGVPWTNACNVPVPSSGRVGVLKECNFFWKDAQIDGAQKFWSLALEQDKRTMIDLQIPMFQTWCARVHYDDTKFEPIKIIQLNKSHGKSFSNLSCTTIICHLALFFLKLLKNTLFRGPLLSTLKRFTLQPYWITKTKQNRTEQNRTEQKKRKEKKRKEKKRKEKKRKEKKRKEKKRKEKKTNKQTNKKLLPHTKVSFFGRLSLV